MKNKILLVPFILFGTLAVSSCGSTGQNTTSVATSDTTAKAPKELTDMTGVTSYYECPMKCEGKKFAEAGSCPICGMELVLVDMKNDSAKTATDTINKM